MWSGLVNGTDPGLLSQPAQGVLELLRDEDALFHQDLADRSGLLKSQADNAIAELVSGGHITCDSFAGLRALLLPEKFKTRSGQSRTSFEAQLSGRWALIDKVEGEEDLESYARIFLKRYGVVFRRLLLRESFCPPWRDLVRVLRQMEARGVVRGGRFVDRWGEQYALPEAVATMRKLRKEKKKGELVSVSACDPVNLIGIITPEKRIPAVQGNRLLFRDGELVGKVEGKQIHVESNGKVQEWELKKALLKKQVPRYLGRTVF